MADIKAKIEFHSGKRLAVARKLKGLMQKQLVDYTNFPHVSLKTIGRWETDGIIQSRVEEISQFFGVSSWVFLDTGLQPSQFEQIIVNPQLQVEYLALQRQQQGIKPQASPLREPIEKIEVITLFQSLKDAIRAHNMDQFEENIDHLPTHYYTQEGWSLLFWAAFEDNSSALELLIEEGFDIHHQDLEGLTPLLVAIARGTKATAKRLLEKGADADHQDHQGWSALHWAVMGRNYEIAEFLLQCGANPDLKDNQGRSPLYRAVSSGNDAMAECLIRHHANPLLETLQGVSPALLAEKEKNAHLLELFLKTEVMD